MIHLEGCDDFTSRIIAVSRHGVGRPAVSGESAFAEDAWPSREIHSICGFPPGSGADVFVRFYGKKLEDKLGKTIITENKVGAFGNIATEFVSESKPDGYTLFIAPGSSFLAAAPSLFKKLAYDPVNDFEHVTTLSKLPFILIVSGDSPYKIVAEFTAYLKQQGDKASYASVANTGIVSSELYKANFGLNTIEVKYKDAGAMLNDLWGHNVVFAHLDPVTSMAHLKRASCARSRPPQSSGSCRCRIFRAPRRLASQIRTSSPGGPCICQRARRSRCLTGSRRCSIRLRSTTRLGNSWPIWAVIRSRAIRRC